MREERLENFHLAAYVVPVLALLLWAPYMGWYAYNLYPAPQSTGSVTNVQVTGLATIV
ncbi:hypothetical protein LCGC14_2950890, partial [marine sediment metagenome]